MNVDLRLGDCLEVLKTIPDNSVDSIVTDPPYGLEFMGKEWDTFKEGRISKYKEGGEINLEQIESRKGKGGAGPSYTKRAAARCSKCGKQRWSGSPCKCEEPDFEIDNSTQHTFQSFSEAWATECYRVLKPGGHLLAFGGSRMYHRLACGVEDAGFEIRDQIMWVYGSGFPKSLNIGKAIDKRGGESIGWFGDWLKEWREENNIQQNEVSKLFPSKTGGLTGCVANWEKGYNLPTNEQFNLICETFNLPFKSLEEAEREFIGRDKNWGNKGSVPLTGYKEFDITKGNSDLEGWGTALKPAHEPIVMARKPLSEKSIAENVLKHGTGGINIDASRISTDDTSGRFPANIIFDEEAGKLLDEQSDKASRFFYCPKTSKKDRNEGLDKPSAHPTVKPTDLMRYLINLVTPQGGTTLDPFMGSGSTGKAAVRCGVNFIGIEKEQEYMDIAKARIEHEKNKPVQTKLL